jgi:hypothetical protein
MIADNQINKRQRLQIIILVVMKSFAFQHETSLPDAG